VTSAGAITDEQIYAAFLRGEISADDAHEALNLPGDVWPQEQARARERVAEILRVRAAEKTP